MHRLSHSIVVTEADWSALLQHFAARPDERMAFGYCGVSAYEQGNEFLVRNIDLPGDGEYRFQSAGGISLKAEHVVQRVVKARGYAAFLDMHSHPFTAYPSPSSTDETGAAVQRRVLRDLAPGVILVRMVFGKHGAVYAEVLRNDPEVRAPIDRIIVLGPERRHVVYPINSVPRDIDQSQHRDLRTAAVLGDQSAASIRKLRVTVIGVGGVGSSVITQLRAYVDHLSIIDPDVVEVHNAPRLYNYVDGDAGLPKVRIHAREIQRAFPDCRVEPLCGTFPDDASLVAFKRADVVFCCPDHNAVRYAAAVAGARFMKPVIEVGCGGKSLDGRISALGYHVRLQVPGCTCLRCNGLDLTQLEDPASSDMKRRAAYVDGDDVVVGELMALTTRAAADAVDIFFRYTTGYAGAVPRHLYFDALALRSIDLTGSYMPDVACTLCGSTEIAISGAGDQLAPGQQVLSPPTGSHASVATFSEHDGGMP